MLSSGPYGANSYQEMSITATKAFPEVHHQIATRHLEKQTLFCSAEHMESRNLSQVLIAGFCSPTDRKWTGRLLVEGVAFWAKIYERNDQPSSHGYLAEFEKCFP